MILPAFMGDERVRCYVRRRENNNKAYNKRHTQTHKAITYFCKESFEEFPVLEVGVVKKEGG